MKKVYKKLTEKQKKEGLIFTSTLSEKETEQKGDTIHKVYSTDRDKTRKIALLKDDKFFDSSPWNYNIIRN